MWTLLVGAALASPNVYVDGPCPGPASVRITHATPGGRVAMVRAAGPGVARVPTGVCAGAAVELASPSLVAVGAADAAGELLLRPTLGAPACGAWLAAIDLDTCTASAPTPVTALPTLDLTFTDAWFTTHIQRSGAGWAVVYPNRDGYAVATQLRDDGTVAASVVLDAAPSSLTVLPGSGDWLLYGGTLAGQGSAIRLDAGLSPVWATAASPRPLSGAAVAPDGRTIALGVQDAGFDAQGNALWLRTSSAGVMSLTASRGVSTWVVAGATVSPDDNGVITRLDDDGLTLTEDVYDTGDFDAGRRVFELPGGSLLALFQRATQTRVSCVVSHLGATGAVLWARDIDLPGAGSGFICHDMIPAHDGVIVVGAALHPTGFDAVAAHVDGEGEVHWARTYGLGVVHTAAPAPYGGAALVVADNPRWGRVVTIDANGRNSCAHNELAATSTPVTLNLIPRFASAFATSVVGAPTTVTSTPAAPAVLDTCL